MNSSISEYIKNLRFAGDDKYVDISEFLVKIKFYPPKDYLEFMQDFGSCEGPVGKNSWLVLWSLDELIRINSIYDIVLENPDLFLFGKDAADTGYVFNKDDNRIYEIGLMASRETDREEFLAENFVNFLDCLYKR